MRALILVHRYLGIGVGLLMVLWCLSGVVMIYAPFPSADEQIRLLGLAPIEWGRVNSTALTVLEGSDRFSRFQLETIAGAPVLRLWSVDGRMFMIDAARGVVLRPINEQQAIDAARRYGMSLGTTVTQPAAQKILYDQWTVAGSAKDRPLYRVALGDSADTDIYVSSRTGRVVQATDRRQRFWGWLGPVPHWLYPTMLRSHPEIWSQVVIWASLTGVFLTVCGLLIGIIVFTRSSRLRRISAYRGAMYWHHASGLVFGILALTWVLSGLFSMNPWGLMEGASLAEARTRLAGDGFTGEEIRSFLGALAVKAPAGVQSVDSAPLGGRFFAALTYKDGSRVRTDNTGATNAIRTDEIIAATQRLAGNNATWTLLDIEDAYHYSLLKVRVTLPVIRVRSSGGDFYYLDPVSGTLIDRADASERAYRWWYSALHRWDFSAALRSTLGRTLVMLPLLIGTTILCILGVYLAVRYVTADYGGRSP